MNANAANSDPLLPSSPSSPSAAPQLLHLVFGGELSSLESTQFKDVAKLDIVGVFPNYAEAHSAWKAAAQKSVDNAQMRYFVVHLHRLLDPSHAGNSMPGVEGRS